MRKHLAVLLSLVLFISAVFMPIDISAADSRYLDHYLFDFTNVGYFTDQLSKADGSGVQLDAEKPWQETITFDAGYDRGDVTLRPVNNHVTGNNWGPQAWSQPGSVTVDGETVDTWKVTANHSSNNLFVPLTAEGKPFELAPGHKYTIKYNFYISDVTQNMHLEYYTGLYIDGAPKYNYTSLSNPINFAGNRFAWIYTTEIGTIEEGTLTLDLTSLAEDENYDITTNTYNLTYGDVEYKLYNYFYFAATAGKATLDFISLEITRDDYVPMGTVEYYDEDGTTLLKSETVPAGNYTVDFVPENYEDRIFLDWYTDADYTTKVTNSTVTLTEEGIKLYSKWRYYVDWSAKLDSKYVFNFTNEGYYSDRALKTGQNYYDKTFPWHIGAVSFDAGYGRGTRKVQPVYSLVSTNDWGPQVWSQPGSVEYVGETFKTLNVYRQHESYFVPLKENGQPFELAPGHKYTVKYKYYVNYVEASTSPHIALDLGLDSNGTFLYDYSSLKNKLNYQDIRFGWLGGKVGTVQEGTLTIDTTSLVSDTNYDYQTNTYALTVNDKVYTLYNYLYFSVTSGDVGLDFISLEVVRDDHVGYGDIIYMGEDGQTVINAERVLAGSYNVSYFPADSYDKVFAGWYTDKELTKKAANPITLTEEGIVLYSKWGEAGNWDEYLDKKYVFDFTNEDYYADRALKDGQTLYDGTLPWNIGAVTFNAGYGRGDRKVNPVYSLVSEYDWGPQIWSQSGSAVIDGEKINTLNVYRQHESYFVPLKEDGKPFELAPGHKYSVKYKYYVNSVAEGKTPFLAANLGLSSTGVMEYDYTALNNKVKYSEVRFGWLGNEIGTFKEGTFTIDTTSLIGDENFDNLTNTYKITVGENEYTLYNYLYFTITNGNAGIDFVSLEITRDDYSEIENGQFLVNNKISNQITYKVTFDYVVNEEISSDIGIGFKTTAVGGAGTPSYIEGKNIAIYNIPANKNVGTFYKATVLLTTDMCATLFRDNKGYNDTWLADNSVLYGYVIGDAQKISICNIEAVELKDVSGHNFIGFYGGQVLNEAAEGSLNAQAIRYTFYYDSKTGNELYVDGKYYTIKERGFIYANGKKFAADGVYEGDMNLKNAKAGAYYYTSKAEGFTNCWDSVYVYDGVYNVGFSNYVTDFKVNDDRELMARGYLVVEIDGQEFTVYSKMINRSVNYIKGTDDATYDPTAQQGERQLVWGYDFSELSSVSEITDFHQNHNQNGFNTYEGDNRNAVIGGDNWVIEDGVMKLKITKSEKDGYLYDIPMTLSTRDKMSFLYGYLEIEAEIPIEYGVHAGFWTVSQSYTSSGAYDHVATEFDIYEVDGRYNPTNPNIKFIEKAVPVSNLHKWYKYYDYETDSRVTTTTNIGSLKYSNTVTTVGDIFGDYTANNLKYTKPDGSYMTLEEGRQLHKYAMEWNPEYIAFLVDGVEYFRTYISEEYDFYTEGHENSMGMKSLHKEQNVLLSFCPRWNGYSWALGGDLNNASYYDSKYENGILDVTSNGEQVIEYKIHSIKLYQREGETINRNF